VVSKAWPDFGAVDMVWGAINELTALTGYRRLVALTGHPVLADLLGRIALDESRHFFFSSRQAEAVRRLPGVETVQLLESWMDPHPPAARYFDRGLGPAYTRRSDGQATAAVGDRQPDLAPPDGEADPGAPGGGGPLRRSRGSASSRSRGSSGR
jgi:hypothetical protein